MTDRLGTRSPMLAIRSGIALVLMAGAVAGSTAALMDGRGDTTHPRTAAVLACVAAALVLFGAMLLLTERIMSAQMARAVRDGPVHDAPATKPPLARLPRRAMFARLGPAALLIVLGYLALRRFV